MIIANSMGVIPVACFYGLVSFALICWYVRWEMDNFKNDRLAFKPCYNYKDVDKEIYRLVRMLNCIPYLYTTCSCSGHDVNPIRKYGLIFQLRRLILLCIISLII